ncbi:hypothetical protein ABZ027_12760 [Streptomyces sp. NPDC006332]|uniref:hypothetical protein n=1 Tax=Streptomyces sp. NPDC006332 TaxID=3155456 RepID=UPI0033BC9F8B
MATLRVAALVCLMGAAVAGCGDGSGAEERSAQQILDDANDTMSALKSVTVDMTSGPRFSMRVTTDLKSRCTSRVTWGNGARLEQIRIGGTDYVRPNRAYLERWKDSAVSGRDDQKRWIKVPADRAVPGDGLSECPREFASFGKATKGGSTEVDGRPAIALMVTDKADKGGTYTFHVATEGKPHILKVVYKRAGERTTTTYSAFDEPLGVRAPAKADVLDATEGDRIG